MNLTHEDLQSIRTVVQETMSPLQGDIKALTNDSKEIYGMIAGLEKSTDAEGVFEKMTIEKKILRLHSELIEAARQAGVSLPGH